LVSWQGTVT